MRVHTLAQAKRNLAALLDEARRNGMVQIQDAEGQLYVLKHERRGASPLDVEGLDLGVPFREMLRAARSPRERE